jgi:thiamine biosynthesis lipoprotein
VRNRVAAVTVVASSCMLADAWATALLVLGEVAGVALAQKRGMDALFVMRDGAGFQQISIVSGQIARDPSLDDERLGRLEQ